MIVVYRAAGPVDAQLVADELRAQGIGCEISGGYLSGAIGELPPTRWAGTRSTLWRQAPMN